MLAARRPTEQQRLPIGHRKELALSDDGLHLYWNDPDTILRGGHWWVAREGAGRPTSLEEIVNRSNEGLAGRCVLAHIGFLGQLLDAADDLHSALADGLGSDAGRPGSVDPGSPLGGTCTDLAAAIDAWVYDLSRALQVGNGELGPKASRLVLDASQVSVYLRSLVGAHQWPMPRSAA